MAKWFILNIVLYCQILQGICAQEDPYPADENGNFNIATDDYQFLVGHDSTLNWQQAIETCQQLGGALVTFDSQKKLIQLHEFLLFKNFIQTKLNEVNPPYIYWSSGNDLEEPRTFAWESSGEEFKYTHWLHQLPEPIAGGGCVQFGDKAFGRWSIRDCNDELYYICDMPKENSKKSSEESSKESSNELAEEDSD
ncbi:C-type lectin 37Db-like [Eurosta solidaginis]|uniref:C-type lectin 37Db-like n=1 Tax=Eurosta solidaginis TaxID=178769 RepID=UPI003531489A